MRSLASSLFYRLLFVSVSCSRSPQFYIYRLVVATGDSDNHSSLFPSLPLSQRSPCLSKVLAASLSLLFGSRRRLCCSRDWAPRRLQFSRPWSSLSFSHFRFPLCWFSVSFSPLDSYLVQFPAPSQYLLKAIHRLPTSRFASSVLLDVISFFPTVLNDLPRSGDLT